MSCAQRGRLSSRAWSRLLGALGRSSCLCPNLARLRALAGACTCIPQSRRTPARRFLGVDRTYYGLAAPPSLGPSPRDLQGEFPHHRTSSAKPEDDVGWRWRGRRWASAPPVCSEPEPPPVRPAPPSVDPSPHLRTALCRDPQSQLPLN